MEKVGGQQFSENEIEGSMGWWREERSRGSRLDCLNLSDKEVP